MQARSQSRGQLEERGALALPPGDELAVPKLDGLKELSDVAQLVGEEIRDGFERREPIVGDGELREIGGLREELERLEGGQLYLPIVERSERGDGAEMIELIQVLVVERGRLAAAELRASVECVGLDLNGDAQPHLVDFHALEIELVQARFGALGDHQPRRLGALGQLVCRGLGLGNFVLVHPPLVWIDIRRVRDLRQSSLHSHESGDQGLLEADGERLQRDAHLLDALDAAAVIRLIGERKEEHRRERPIRRTRRRMDSAPAPSDGRRRRLAPCAHDGAPRVLEERGGSCLERGRVSREASAIARALRSLGKQHWEIRRLDRRVDLDHIDGELHGLPRRAARGSDAHQVSIDVIEGDAKNLRWLDVDDGEPYTAQMDVQHLDGDQLERRRLGGAALGNGGAVSGAGVGGDAQPLWHAHHGARWHAHHGALWHAYVELAHWADRMQL